MTRFPLVTPGVVVVRAQPQHAAQLADLQLLSFPTLAERERFKVDHYLHHIRMFPEGQLVALDGERVVGATSTIRLDFDFSHAVHTFAEIIQGGWLTAHQPQGSWLYGADLSVAPGYRGRGIARALYAARHALVHHLDLAGQVTVGMLSGYGAQRHLLSAQQYYDRVVSGELMDPTVSMQRRIGFLPGGLIPGYLDDPACAGYGVLLVLPASTQVSA